MKEINKIHIINSEFQSKFNITEAENLEIGRFELFPELNHYVPYGYVYGIKYKLWPPALFVTFLIRKFLGFNDELPHEFILVRSFQNAQNSAHQGVAVINTALINPTFLLSRIPEEHRDRIIFYTDSLPNFAILPQKSILLHLTKNFAKEELFTSNWMNFTPEKFLINSCAHIPKLFKADKRFNRSKTSTTDRFTINQLRKIARKKKLAIFIVSHESLPSLDIFKETYITKTYTAFSKSTNKIETLVDIYLVKNDQRIRLKEANGYLHIRSSSKTSLPTQYVDECFV